MLCSFAVLFKGLYQVLIGTYQDQQNMRPVLNELRHETRAQTKVREHVEDLTGIDLIQTQIC